MLIKKRLFYFPSSYPQRALAIASLLSPINLYAADCPNTISTDLTTGCTMVTGQSLTIDNGVTISSPQNGIEINSAVTSINNNGTLSGGISLTVGTMTGSIINSGTISGSINLTNQSHITGSINNGEGNTIQSITIDDSTIKRGITNEGTIDSINLDAGTIGIFNNPSSIGQTVHITNNGIIGNGISFNNTSRITGNITNNATGTINGISLTNQSGIAGEISNNGTINGIHLDASTIGIFNNQSNTLLLSDISNNDTINGGISLSNSSVITGNIDNSGDITVNTSGTAGLSLTNSSHIFGQLNNAANSTIGISSNNTALINTVGIRVGSDSTDTSNIIDGIVNRGTIRGTSYALQLLSDSDYVDGTTTRVATNRVENHGTLDGHVALGSWQLYIRGNNARIIGDVTGSNDSTVHINGDFTSEGTFNIGTFNLWQNSHFMQQQAITTTSGFNNDGTLTIADGSQVTIGGNYTQFSNGMIQTYVTSASSYGQLSISGTADLSASSQFDVVVSANEQLYHGDTLDNVLSAGNLLTANTLSVTDNSALWDFSAINDGNNNVDLIAQYLGFVAPGQNTIPSPTDNNISIPVWAEGVATLLDTFYRGETPVTDDMNTIMGELNTLSTPDEVSDAVQQLTPALESSGQKASILSTTDQILHVMQSQVLGNTGLSSGDEVSEQVLWLRPFYRDTQQEEHSNINGYDANTYGLLLGIDSHLSQQWVLGLGLAYADTRVSGTQQVSGQKLNVTSYELIGFAHYTPSTQSFLNLTTAAGITQINSERYIQFAGINRIATAEHDGWYSQLEIEAGYHFLYSDNLVISPNIKANYIHIDKQGYTETGAGALNLQVDKVDSDTLFLGFGADIEWQPIESSSTFLDTYLSLGYDVLSEQNITTATLAGGGSRFATIGIENDPLLIKSGLGLRFIQNQSFTTHIHYDVEVRDNYMSQMVSAHLEYTF